MATNDQPTNPLLDAMQRHHDLFVRLYREKGGKLDYKDISEYETAMERERHGTVKPIA